MELDLRHHPPAVVQLAASAPVITGGLKVPIVGALFLLTVYPDLGAVHVEHHAPRYIESFSVGDQLSIKRSYTDCRSASARDS